MCLLFFSYKTTPGYTLVLAANRDEFSKRATAPLNYIDEKRSILAGLDLQGGGTWLGINRKGKIAALTNYREGGKQIGDAPSRGEILRSYLSSEDSAAGFLNSLEKYSSQYNGFNLILGDRDSFCYYSSQKKRRILLQPGFYGLSNHFLDTPWPKVKRGKELLRSFMVDTERVDTETIFLQLRDSYRPPDSMLPDTGVGLGWERLLSTIFIESPDYGTLSSAVITVEESGKMIFTEKTHCSEKNRDTGIVQFTFG